MPTINFNKLAHGISRVERIIKVEKVVCEYWDGITFTKNKIYKVLPNSEPLGNNGSGAFAWYKYERFGSATTPHEAKFRPAYKNDKEA